MSKTSSKVFKLVCTHGEDCGGILTHGILVPVEELARLEWLDLHNSCSGKAHFEETDCPHPKGADWHHLGCCEGNKCLLCREEFHSPTCSRRDK